MPARVNLEVSLAGFKTPWRMHGSRALAAWLDDQPWLAEGGVRALRIDPAFADEVQRAVTRMVYAIDARRTKVFVTPLAIEPGVDGAARALATHLGLDERPSDRLLADRLGAEVKRAPCVFVVRAEGSGPVGDRLEAFIRLLEMVRKIGHERAPAVVLLHDAADAAGPETLRFDWGMPLEAAEAATAPYTPGPTAWRAYVHARAAWEAGGRLADALTIAGAGLDDLPMWDDDGLEVLLNGLATTTFAARPASEREAWRRYLRSVADNPDGRLRGRPDDAPPESSPAPAWVARAIALEGDSAIQRHFLRGLMLCQPLAEGMLTRLFASETLIRAHVVFRADLKLTQSMEDRFKRFQEQDFVIERRLYPPSHPAIPNSPWAFASLGDVKFSGFTFSSGLMDRLNKTLHLRNALAHGHPPGWEGVKWVREVASAAIGG